MRLARPATILLAAALLSGCANTEDETLEQDRPGIGTNGRRDLIGTDADISGKKGDRTYIVYATLRDHRGSGKAFADYGCEGDCADIRAGYQAAAARGTKDMRQCAGATWGELEGCVAFTEERRPVITNLPPLDKE